MAEPALPSSFPPSSDPLDKLFNDPEWQAYAKRMSDPNPPATRQKRMQELQETLAQIEQKVRSRGATTAPPMPASGARTFSRPRPLPANEQQTLAVLKSIQDQLIDLRTRMNKYGQQKWDSASLPQRWYDYELRRRLKTSTEPGSTPGTEDRDTLMDSLIATEAQAQAALAHSSGTRAFQFIQGSQGHIPHAAGDFKYNMDAINFLLSDRGPYKSAIRAMGVDPGKDVTPTPKATPSATSADDPYGLRKHGLAP